MIETTIIESTDYGFIAYLIFKYDGKRVKNGVELIGSFNDMQLLREYNNTDFPLYNEVLKKVVKDK